MLGEGENADNSDNEEILHRDEDVPLNSTLVAKRRKVQHQSQDMRIENWTTRADDNNVVVTEIDNLPLQERTK